MPNWCANTIKVSGPKEDLEQFLEAAKSVVEEYGVNGIKTDLSLDKLYPIPDNLLEGGWNNWRVQNWGTKWDVESCQADVTHLTNESLAIFETNSAWEPPLEAFRYISTLYPTLTFNTTYDEPGNDFAGVEVVKNGEVVHWETSMVRPSSAAQCTAVHLVLEMLRSCTVVGCLSCEDGQNLGLWLLRDNIWRVSAVFFLDVFPLTLCHTFLNNFLFFRRGVPAVAQARTHTLAHL